MINRKILFLIAMFMPLGAVAQVVDYTFVQASYLDNRIHTNPDVDGGQLKLKGSLSLSRKVFAFAQFAKGDYDLDIESTQYGLGLGMHWWLRPKLDVYGKVGWVHRRIDTSHATGYNDGLGLDVGLRSRLTRHIGLQAAIRYLNLNHSDTSLALNARYFMNDSLAVGVGYDIHDDHNGWRIGIRVQFGP